MGKLCLGWGGQAFVAAWGVFIWAASVGFPVIIIQPHRIEGINEYVGGEVTDDYLPFSWGWDGTAWEVQGEKFHCVFACVCGHVHACAGVCVRFGKMSKETDSNVILVFLS